MPQRRRTLLALLAAFVPGFLAGAHLVALVYFLNPHLPLDPFRFLRGFAVYGPVLGLAGVALALPLVVRRPRMVLRLLPWALSTVLLGAAALDGFHASRFAFYLPGGINVRLIKAALWLTLAGLIAFYTSLLHALHHRRYGFRSRSLLASVALLSVLVVIERREAYRPPRESALASAVEPTRAPALIVVGLEAGTLDAVLPLAEQGSLPFFAELLREGSYGRLRTLTPTRSGAAWTTLATGKLPYHHGITGPLVYPTPPWIERGGEWRLLPVVPGFAVWGTGRAEPRPPSAGDRRVLPLWEVLPRLGLPAGMIGWPLGDAASGARFVVDRDVFLGHGSAWPSDLGVQARLFRPGPQEISSALLDEFEAPVREAAESALAADLWRESLAYFLLGRFGDTRALLLRLPGLGAVSRAAFGGYDAVQLEGRRGVVHEESARFLAAYYAHLDEFLGGLWAREADPPIFAVVSAYGVAPPAVWRRALGLVGGEPAVGGRVGGGADGFLLIRGPGVRPGHRIEGARIEDVVPTLVYGLGLPVARDLDGRVLTEAFVPEALGGRPLRVLPSYEALDPPRE